MATTHDGTSLEYFMGFTPTYSSGAGRFGMVRFHVDMAQVAADLAATIDGSSSDVIQIWDIPYPCQILSCLAYLWTPEGAACTVTVGDNAGVNTYLTTFSLNGDAGSMAGTSTSDTYGGAAGKIYTSADTLDLLFATAADIDVAVFDLIMPVIFFDVPDLTISAPATWK